MPTGGCGYRIRSISYSQTSAVTLADIAVCVVKPSETKNCEIEAVLKINLTTVDWTVVKQSSADPQLGMQGLNNTSSITL